MKLVNGKSTCAYGKKPYAESTLKNMKKSELIDLLHAALHNYETLLENFDKLLKYAEQLQKGQTSNWIPCSEKLPEENGRYIVTQDVCCISTGLKIKTNLDYVEFYNGVWCRAKHLKVIAWQPLPAPYEKEK